MRRTIILAGTVLCIGALTGCGGSSGEPAAVTAAAATAPSPAPEAAGDASDGATDGKSGTASFTDAQACAWLAENLPKWKDISDEVSVQAQITIGLSSFFEDHGGLENADGYAYDAATSRGCRAEHDAALKQAGIKTFGAL
jgi:hypothetical protein